jgi:D-amino-acid dehydrogenase
MRHIAVIGAGITGVTTAYALSEKGYTVTVFDRNRYAAMETSFANGGQLSASNAEVWNNWGTVWKGIKWMFRKDAPLLVNLKPSWHKYSWMAEFIANIPHYRENTIATTKLAIEGRKYMFEMAERENIDFDLEKRGILHVYQSKAEFDHATEVNALLKEGGLDRRPVTPGEIKTIEPALKGEFYGGFFTPSDSTGDIHKFTTGLAEAAKKQGANFILDADVQQLSVSGRPRVTWRDNHGADVGMMKSLEVDAIVICAGSHSPHFARMVGDRVNIYPVKGYSITVLMDDEESRAGAPWVSLLDDHAKIVTSRYKDRFRVAGTAEFNGYNRDIRHDRIKPLIEWVNKFFPQVNTSQSVPWAGLRPMMPNMLPRVGPGSKTGIYYNTGHGHLGWTLSAATAELIAARIETDLPIDGVGGQHVAAPKRMAAV